MRVKNLKIITGYSNNLTSNKMKVNENTIMIMLLSEKLPMPVQRQKDVL